MFRRTVLLLLQALMYMWTQSLTQAEDGQEGRVVLLQGTRGGQHSWSRSLQAGPTSAICMGRTMQYVGVARHWLACMCVWARGVRAARANGMHVARQLVRLVVMSCLTTACPPLH